VQGESLEVVQLKAALQRHASDVASAASKEELVAALSRVVDTAFSVAQTQGVSRIELESRLRPPTHARSVFRHVSELRSSMARAALDGSVRVTSRLYPRWQAVDPTCSARTDLPLTSPAIAARSAKLHDTVTVVTQRFLGSRSMPLTRVRSFTRVVPAARDWTLDAMELRWLRTPGPAVQAAPSGINAATSVTRSPEIPTVVLSSSDFRSARWLGRRPPRVPAGNVLTTALTFPPRIQIASRKELARWAVTATSEMIVERLVLPYLRRLAAQRMQAVAAGSFGQVLQIAVPFGYRWLLNESFRNN
jgi:hypothetical protein